jgi:hypothetical protein
MTQQQNSFEQDALLCGIFENQKNPSKIKSYFKSGIEKSLIRFFTDLARTPDLNESVLMILKPALLRSYSLISGEHKNTFSPENRRKIENILGRDFPKLLSIYQTIPLDTRNEQIITDNKTYRQNLIENFAYLVAKLREIEEEALHSVQQQTLMTNQVIREYYGNLNITPESKSTISTILTEEKLSEVVTQHLPASQKEYLVKCMNQFPEFSWFKVKDKLMSLQKSRIEKKLLASEKKEQEKITKSVNQKKEKSSYFIGFTEITIVLIFGLVGIMLGGQLQDRIEYQKIHIENTQMIQGLKDLLNRQAESVNSVGTVKLAQNPDYQYYLPHLQWYKNADKKTMHITINKFDNWGCRSALNNMPEDQYDWVYGVSNVQINHHPVSIQNLKSVHNKNEAFCTMDNNNQLDYDIQFIQ